VVALQPGTTSAKLMDVRDDRDERDIEDLDGTFPEGTLPTGQITPPRSWIGLVVVVAVPPPPLPGSAAMAAGSSCATACPKASAKPEAIPGGKSDPAFDGFPRQGSANFAPRPGVFTAALESVDEFTEAD